LATTAELLSKIRAGAEKFNDGFAKTNNAINAGNEDKFAEAQKDAVAASKLFAQSKTAIAQANELVLDPDLTDIGAKLGRAQRWAGTLDAIATFDRDLFDDAALRVFQDDDMPTPMRLEGQTLRLLVDYKTGKGVYPEVALQLAGYRYADTFLGGPDASETTMPQVDGCAVLHLREDGYDLIPIRVDDDTFTTLQYTREMHRWQIEGSKEAVGAPNTPPRSESGDE
ncbi:hypothetical protein LCGC14_2622160, partial [marine sediment metagenome]